MKMIEDTRLLAHKRRVDAERRAAAIARVEGPKRIAAHNAALAMARVASAPRPVPVTEVKPEVKPRIIHWSRFGLTTACGRHLDSLALTRTPSQVTCRSAGCRKAAGL